MGTNGSTRKISCLPCRSKKAKCDGQAPCCRCVRNSRENQCIYPKMRTFGRPPKNAVFHTSVTMGTSSRANENLVCREFIFEYDQNTSSNNDKELIQQPNLKIHKDIEEIFSLHLQRGSALREKMLRTNQFISKPRHIKMTGLAQQFSWLGSSMANIAIKRIGQIQLESFHDPEIALSCFIRPEAITRFFYFSQKPMPASDPLNSLPTDNALKLIDYFFQYQPYCILVNKTRLLQEYWDDTADPFLLSVIYGTTLYSSQILEGKPLILYEASEDSKRNPFLNYAYILLEKKLNAGEAGITSTKLSSYQAAVILGVFEVLFGLPKHGMTILSLSYKMATDLGIFDGSLEDMDVISKEQLIMTYWAAFRATSYGCIELGLFVRDSLTCHNQPFPPVSVHNSASFQFDLANNNIHSYPSQSYLFEAYHTEIVIIHFTTRIFACIPKPQYNMFGYPTQTEIYEAETFSNMVYSIKDQVHAKIQLVLNNFDEFIQDQSPNWSPLQLYAIESVYQLYSIHLKFIKTKLTFSTRLFESPIRYLDQDNTWLTFNVDNTESTPEDTILSELDLADPAVVAQLTSVFPLVLTLIEKMELFLQSPKNYHENTATLPFGLMASILETAARLFILKYQLEPENREVMQKQIQSVYALSKHDIWKQHFTTAKVIQKRLKNYLKSMPSNRRTENPPVDILMNDWGALVYWDQDPPISLQEFDDLFEQSFFQSLT